MLHENIKVVFPIEQKALRAKMRSSRISKYLLCSTARARNKSCAMEDTRAQECMKHTFVLILIFSGKENKDETTYDSQ